MDVEDEEEEETKIRTVLGDVCIRAEVYHRNNILCQREKLLIWKTYWIRQESTATAKRI